MSLKNGLYVGLVVLVVYGAYTVIRSIYLLKSSSALYKTSDAFSRDYVIGDAQAKSFLIVALGDSTVVGSGVEKVEDSLVYKIAQSYLADKKSVHIINYGVSGARVKDVVNGQLPQLDKLTPDVVLLSVGANDSTHFTPKNAYKQDLATLAEALHKTKAAVFFATAPDLRYAPALPAWFGYTVSKHAAAQNAELQQLTKDSIIRIVDLYENGKLDYTKDKELYARDLFHPSAKGYTKWAEVFVGTHSAAHQ